MAADWAAIRVEYVNGAEQYKALAKRHGLKEATVRQRANREGWQEQRHAASQAVTARASAVLADDRTEALAKFNEDDLRVARAIRSQVAVHINDAQVAKKRIASADLRALAAAAEASQRIGRLALGVTTANTGLSAPGGGPIELERADSDARAQLRAKLGLP